MNRSLTLCILAGALFAGGTELFAHGGTYVGPGDVTPPGGGTPPPGGPPTPPTPPKGPPTGPPTGPTPPSGPTQPDRPITPPSPHGPGGTPVYTGGGNVDTRDYASWQFWWEFNKHRFLNLRVKVHGFVESADDSVFAGLGLAEANRAPNEQQIRTVLLPALYAAAKDESNADILTAVMIAVARTGRDDGSAAALFAQNLDAPSREVAETAALSYGILRDPAALDSVLLHLLNDDAEGRKMASDHEVPIRTRAFAAYGMALIGAASNDGEVQLWVLQQLLHTLETDRSSAQDLRVAAAVGIGMLRPQDPQVAAEGVNRLAAVLAAGRQDDLVLAHLPNAMAKLLRGLSKDERVLRDRVLDATLALLDPRAKSGAYLEQSAVMTLGLLARPQDARSKEIFAALQQAASGAKDTQARNFSAISLAYLGAADPDFDAEANRQPVTRALLQGLRKSSSSYEAWCGLALGVQSFMLEERGFNTPPMVTSALLERFESARAPEQLSAFAIGLGLMRHRNAAAAIRQRMDGIADTEFLGYASLALGLLQAGEHADALMTLVETKKRDPDLLRQAAIGLGLMENPQALGRLMEYLNPPTGRPTLSVLAAAAIAIGFIGDQASVRPLTDFLKNPAITPLGRAFAAAALGMVGDPDLLPWHAPIGEDLNYRATVPTLVDPSLATGILDLL
jgi:hypothetical protein